MSSNRIPCMSHTAVIGGKSQSMRAFRRSRSPRSATWPGPGRRTSGATSTTSKPRKSIPVRARTSSSAWKPSGRRSPGVPVAGRVGRVDEVDVEREERRPAPTRARTRSAYSAGLTGAPARCQVSISMPSVACIARSSGPYSEPRIPACSERAGSIRPSSSARRNSVPWLYGPPEVALPDVAVRVEVHEPERAVHRQRGAQLGERHGVVAADADRDRRRPRRSGATNSSMRSSVSAT